ncbi:MAG: hypothetical protein Q8P57_03065 [Candidatus Pacearchaeota archaeon]|nr:hypothetical protein [Candidatus Pacearchaeota archaeon]
MATLEDSDAKLFYKINNELIYFANSRFKLINNFPRPEKETWEEEDIQKIVEKIYSEPKIIVSFCSENPAMLNKEEIEVAKSCKVFVRSKFLVFSHNSKTIFFSSEKEPKAYEVYGLYNEILELVPFEPIMIEAIIISFKGKITYTGSFRLYNMSFGGGYKRGLKLDFEKSVLKFGIISSLDKPIEEKKQSDEEMLRFYLKNKQNKEEYRREINELLRRTPQLNNIYYNEIGKSYVKQTRAILSDISIKDGWFAIVNSQIVASGKTKDEVSERLRDVLPDNKISSAYIFEYKGDKNERKM